MTPLFAASRAGQLELAKLLLFGGADAELLDRRGASPFMVACAGGHLEVARALLDWGAEVDRVDVNGSTAFQLACAGGRTAVAAWLASLEPHVDVRRRDHRGLSPFLAAVLDGRVRRAPHPSAQPLS